jgi:hypothetical protein
MIVVWTSDADAWLPPARPALVVLAGTAHPVLHPREPDPPGTLGIQPVATGRYPFAATHATLSNSLRRYPLHGVHLCWAALLDQTVVYLRLAGDAVHGASSMSARATERRRDIDRLGPPTA